MTRVVHHGDGVAFLRQRFPDDHAIVTSLPDHSELPELGIERAQGDPRGRGRVAGRDSRERASDPIDGWRRWFVETVTLAMSALADDAIAIFYQTDVKHDGRWIDKGHLVMLGTDAADASVLWHKIVCRVPPGQITFGRPAYAHMICASRQRRIEPGASTADVLPALGAMTWSRAMGAAACDVAVRFAAAVGARTIVDPFCGQGSALAAANAHGLSAIGVELSKRRAAKARAATHPVTLR